MPFAHQNKSVWLVLCAFVCVLTLVFGCCQVWPAAAFAQQQKTVDLSASATRTLAAETKAQLFVAPTTPVWSANTADPVVQLSLQAPADTDIPAGEVKINLFTTALASRSELTDLRPATNSREVELASADVAVTTKGAAQELKVRIPIEALVGTATDNVITSPGAFTGAASGTYVLRAVYTPKTKATDASFQQSVLQSSAPVVWEGESALPTVQLGVVIPLLLAANIQTLPSSDALNDAIPAWNRLLDQATALNATLAIDPRIIVALRLRGDKANEAQRFFLQRLEHSRLHQFLLQFADADAAAQGDLGFTKLLAPSSFNFAGGTAARFSQLQQWEQDAHILWPAPGSANTATVQLAQASGYQTLLLDSSNVSSATSPLASLPTAPGVNAFIADNSLTDAVSAVLSASSATEKHLAEATVLAQLSLAGDGVNEAKLLLALPRDNPAGLSEANDLLSLLQHLSWVQPTSLSSFTGGSAQLNQAENSSERLSLLRSASSREATVNKRGRLLQIPALLSGYQRARLLWLFSSANASAAVDFTAVAQRFQERDAELISGVQIVASNNTRVLGTYAKVPVQLYNNLPFTATVSLHVLPTNAAVQLDETEITEIKVPTKTNVSALVPIHSRVSNGDTGIIADVTSLDGKFTSNTATLPISLQSNIETIGMILLSVLAVLLLGFGIFRSIKRKHSGSAE